MIVAMVATVSPLRAGSGDTNGPTNTKPSDHFETFTEQGDPDSAPETIVVDIDKVRRDLADQPVGKRGPRKDARSVAMNMLNFARGLAYPKHAPPITRHSSPKIIRRFIGLWDYTDVNVYFCAMGVGYSACHAYCQTNPTLQVTPQDETRILKSVLPDIRRYYFVPSPSTQIMHMEALKRPIGTPGSWVKKGSIGVQPGWLVIFDWKHDGVPDHVGIIDQAMGANGTHLHTVEFNTNVTIGSQRNGGAIASKVRSTADILGYIRTY